MGLFAWILVGIIAGWLAGQMMPSRIRLVHLGSNKALVFQPASVSNTQTPRCIATEGNRRNMEACFGSIQE